MKAYKPKTLTFNIETICHFILRQVKLKCQVWIIYRRWLFGWCFFKPSVISMLLLVIPYSGASCGERSVHLLWKTLFIWQLDLVVFRLCDLWHEMKTNLNAHIFSLLRCLYQLHIWDTTLEVVASSVCSRISLKFHFIAQSKINNAKIFPGRLRSVLWQSLRCRLNHGSPLLMSSFSALCQQWSWFHLNWRLHLAPCVSLVCFNFISLQNTYRSFSCTFSPVKIALLIS